MVAQWLSSLEASPTWDQSRNLVPHLSAEVLRIPQLRDGRSIRSIIAINAFDIPSSAIDHFSPSSGKKTWFIFITITAAEPRYGFILRVSINGAEKG